MYRVAEKVPEFEKFDMVFGGKLFSSHNGRPALPVRVALVALIIKEKSKLPDEELVEEIRESPYLQYFLGYEWYKDELPFDPSMMVHFRKRLTGNILKEINALIIERAVEEKHSDDDESGNSAGEEEPREEKNQGTLMVDATCAPEDMRFPQDVSLLDEVRRKT